MAGRTSHPFPRTTVLFYTVCLSGLLLSLYAWFGRLAQERDPSYQALFCDITASINCTKALGSRYGRGFGLIDRVVPASSPLNQPNGAILTGNYILHAVLFPLSSRTVTVVEMCLSCLPACLSVYLFYILRYVLDDHCILCYLLHATSYSTFLCCSYKTWSMWKTQGRVKQS